MSEIIAYLREFNIVSVLLRLTLAMLCGGLLGYGRSKKKQNAGLRTYMLVSIGAALTVLISMYEYKMLTGHWADLTALAGEVKFDGARIAAQVIQGIGFLAAGTIIGIAHQQVSGLTTAIGLFASACMGIAAGAGFYECVIVVIVIVILTMELLRPIEDEFKRRTKNIVIHVEFDNIDDIEKIKETIKEQKANIFYIDIERTEREKDEYPSAIFSLKLSKENASHSAILSSVAEMPCVYSVSELIS